MSTVAEQLKPFILDVPDFPKPGIVFKDITPLLAEPSAWRQTIKAMSAEVSKYQPDLLLAIESRGFIFGAAMALEMGIGVHMARKPGKLPRPTKNVTYELEYGQDRLEMHDDLLKFGRRVAIIDDVLATGGTAVQNWSNRWAVKLFVARCSSNWRHWVDERDSQNARLHQCCSIDDACCDSDRPPQHRADQVLGQTR